MNWELILKILFYVLTYGIFAYSVLILGSYILIAALSIRETQKYIRKNRSTDYRILASSAHAPSVSILAPAYNEGKTIVQNVRSILSTYYPNLEVIIINDGSTDDSLEQLIEAYSLHKIDYYIDYKIRSESIKAVYKSKNPIYQKLIVVDKINGGKADALNAGINLSSNELLVCIDVDCIMEQDAILKIVKPFLEETSQKVIASGGVIRIANSCVIEQGKLTKVKLAESYLPRIQILEYIRAFILGRMAWSRLNGLMLISGAFGAFDRNIVIQCGGYNTQTVGEDMELVVRMRRYMEEQKKDYRVVYIPDPLCWTEAPATYEMLGKQRNRWTRGTIETLMIHKKMFFNPRYRLLGMLSHPYWFFFEMCAPLIEFFGFICFFIFAASGLLDWAFFFTYLIFIICFGYLYSAFALFMEVVTYHQYKRRVDVLILLLTGLTEPFYFHPFVVWSAITGYVDYLGKKKGWGDMVRIGFAKKQQPNAVKTLDGPKEQLFVNLSNSVAINRFFEFSIRAGRFLFNCFRDYFGHLIILAGLLFIGKLFELGQNFYVHGIAPRWNVVLLYSFINELAYFEFLLKWLFLPFVLLYLISRTTARWFFIVCSASLLLMQLSLTQYFITTMVPLGSDLWAYSWQEIKQTVGSSGTLSAARLFFLVLLATICVYGLVKLPKRIRAGNGVLVVFIVMFSFVEIRELTQQIGSLSVGNEFGNNTALNKSLYFLKSTYTYFLPDDFEPDIYTQENATANLNQIRTRPDVANYPYYYINNNGADPLSPFFIKSDSMPPHIVIIIVEGLGRAFSNQDAYFGSFTPFLDSLSTKSLYWENFLSTSGRTFSVLPSLLGSLPFGNNGFAELGQSMPKHFSLINILKHNGYATSFFYGGNSQFDYMNTFLNASGIDRIVDEPVFPKGYKKLPDFNGFSWGYDDRSLFSFFLNEKKSPSNQASLSILLTNTTHSPYLINDQQAYLKKLANYIESLKVSDEVKSNYNRYRFQLSALLQTDDALKQFIFQYSKRKDYNNTVFLITGDHRLPEIPMNSKIDRYHVPMIIFSPLLARPAKFSSISSHFDIAPSLCNWLQKQYQVYIPQRVSWLGDGLDTFRKFRNIHAFGLKQTKSNLVDYIAGTSFLNQETLFTITEKMDLVVSDDKSAYNRTMSGFNDFKQQNNLFTKKLALLPDSVYNGYFMHPTDSAFRNNRLKQ